MKVLHYNIEPKQLLIIIAVIALGLLAVNQFLEYRYNLQLMLDPCGVCADKNPILYYCIYANDINKIIKINTTKINQEITISSLEE